MRKSGLFFDGARATLTGNGTFDTATGTTLGWTGDIGGAGALVKTGQGTLVLGGDNQYGGGTTVNAGAVQVARDINLVPRPVRWRFNDARLASTGTFSTARASHRRRATAPSTRPPARRRKWTGDIGALARWSRPVRSTLVLGGDNQYGGGTTVNTGAVTGYARDANLGSRLARWRSMAARWRHRRSFRALAA